MIRSLETAASGMLVQQRNLDVIANNLSNVNTTGFKASRAEFQDLMYQTIRLAGAQQGGSAVLPASQQVGMGAKFMSSATNFAPGALQASDSPFDVAINGDGFFSVTMPDGTVSYTRDGSFKLSAEGKLVTSDGYTVTGDITVPTDAETVTISPGGTVSAKISGQSTAQVLGAINLVSFANPSGLERIGKNLYSASSASGDPVESEPGKNGTGTLEQGFLEGSNVQMVEEMVRMILAQRAYEVNSKAIQAADEMLNATNNLRR